MNFSNFIGQKEVVAGLVNCIKNGKVGHAYIFNGPSGIGKRTLAMIFAAKLFCQATDTNDSCGECMPCKLFENSNNPDFCVIKAEKASIGVDEIREMQSSMYIRPLYSKKKVYIIVDSEKMTLQAQNCLLKTLEEPPEYTVIILTTSNYDAMLETIRSRAIKYNFRKNTLEEVKTFLKEEMHENSKNIDFTASYADGIIGTAKKLAGSDDFFMLREKTIDHIFKIQNSSLVDIFDIYDFFEDNKDRVEDVFVIMTSFYRDALVVKTARENILINCDKEDIIIKCGYKLTVQKIVNDIETIEETHRKIKQNANYQLAIEVMVMKLQEE